MPVLDVGTTVGEQLRALSRQEVEARWELVVVDNGCTDDTMQVVEGFRDRLDLRVVREARRGISHARNAGLAATDAPLIAFCDGDDVVAPGWLHGLLRGIEGADAVGGRLDGRGLNPPEVLAWRGEMDTDGLMRPCDWLPSAPGGNMAVRAAAARSVGGWDPRFAGGSDDVDFSWRLQEAGYSVAWASDAILHYRFRSTPRAVVKQFWQYGRTEPLLYRRHRASGMPRRSARQVARHYAELVMRAGELLRGGAAAVAWRRDAAYLLGRAVGSVEQQVVFL